MFLANIFLEDPLTVFLTGLVLLIMFFWYFATEIERRKRNIGTVLFLGVCALCVMAATPLKERLKGGIDIIGGSSFTLRVQPRETETGEPMPVTPQQIDQAILVIEKRLDALGTASPIIARQGSDKIEVQMPGVEPKEADRIRAILEQVAKLELREVSPRNAETDPNGKTLAARVMDGDEIVPGYRAYTYRGKDMDGNEFSEPILLNRRMALGGSDIANAGPSPQQADAVAITLNGEGENKMIALTRNMRRGEDRIAIVLDGEVISAPTVNHTPLGRNFVIEGLREPGEVENLARALMNPLENPLVVEEERTVSPTLGAAVVEQGLWAGAIGLSITVIFILLYYRTSGIIALFGLAVNAIVLFGVMAMFGFTFTMPGIAGMVLTIGMAVDANVLIYERLREEIAAGKSLKNAISAAYEKAFSAIFDSNITSLIAATVLFWLGSSTLKGFAITLTIGITASLFSAILVTRVMFRWGTDFKLLKNLSFLNLIGATRFDFLGTRRICFVVSLVMVLLALGGFALRGDRALGVDFTGGTVVTFQLGKELDVPLPEVERVLSAIPDLQRRAIAQEQSNPASGAMLTVRCDTKDSDAVVAALKESIPALAPLDVSKEEISAFIGGYFMRDSLIALAVGMICILIYVTVRFEFSFAIGGMVALFHDVLISVGLVVLLGRELSLIHVGAILTIAGYSINDTIVIFDRIRENLLIRTGATKDIMNEAINATLSRTVLTSSTTIITVAVLSLYGGSNLRDFSIMILIGLVVGTYSSIFVASPMVLWWSRRKGGDLRSDVLASEIRAEAEAAT